VQSLRINIIANIQNDRTTEEFLEELEEMLNEYTDGNWFFTYKEED